MFKLVSKIQHKDFEAGEFVEIKERDYYETIKLIEDFPWSKERERIVIDLTNPSITIQGQNNDYLKFALFFNQKFVLHYFNKEQVLFTKTFSDFKYAYADVKKFFDQSVFDPSDFKEETTWFQHNLKHFVTQDFHYNITPLSIRKYLIRTSGFNFLLSFFMIVAAVANYRSMTWGMLLGLLLAMFLMGGGIHLVLFFNFYNHIKGKTLIMSRGNDTFYFGDIEAPEIFDKKDILRYTENRSHGSRNQFNEFAVIDIEFKDGLVLEIPNLLVDYRELENKLFAYPKIENNRFPYI